LTTPSSTPDASAPSTAMEPATEVA
jgi:hypothetical protein